MNILVTGAAGFIGFSLCKKFLDNTNYVIYGVDNIDNYYSVILKKKRIKELKKNKNFKFLKLDLKNNKTFKLLNKKKFKFIFHLAAQPGVRFSTSDPKRYIDENIIAFTKVLEFSRLQKCLCTFYASSSSVYGDQKKMPLKETMNTDTPKSFYAATKKSNEIMSYSYSKIYKMNIVGLRFFTVYGPYGRPDMTPFSFVKNFYKKLPIKIFSFGKHKRDFTYIDDAVITVVDLFTTLIGKKQKSFYEVYNIAKGKSEKLSDYIKYLEYELKSKFKKTYIKEQLGDVKNTFADTNKIRKIIKYKSKVNLKSGVSKFVSWYKKYYNN